MSLLQNFKVLLSRIDCFIIFLRFFLKKKITAKYFLAVHFARFNKFRFKQEAGRFTIKMWVYMPFLNRHIVNCYKRSFHFHIFCKNKRQELMKKFVTFPIIFLKKGSIPLIFYNLPDL